ncbi:MAG: hypothetical protein AB8B91_20625 [Rubripirellula sp.]
MHQDPDKDPALCRRRLLQTVATAPVLATLPFAYGQDPTEQKRIYLAADDHTDYMWTGDEEEYRQAFLETLDHYLNLADQTDHRDKDYQCRWNCDGLLWLREFEQHRSAGQLQRLIKRIKSGHISVPMNMLVSCYGGAPTEAILRGMYYGGIVERKYDLKLTIAVAMENQTLPLGLGMLWAGSGVKYSWRGICGCASKVQHSGGQREHDVYWWVGPDGSRILMKWYSLSPPLRKGVYSNEGPGGYAEARHPELAVNHVVVHPDFVERNPHSVIGLFGQGWDDMKTIVPLDDQTRSFPVVAKRLTNTSRRVIVSNESDYFADIEATHGKELPEQSLAFGNEWDLYSASMAEVSASVKRATEKLRTAEALAVLVSQTDPAFASDLKEMREQAWIAFGLYWEHDWTADGPISRERRATWQRKIAKQITDYVDTLFDRAQRTLSDQMVSSKGEPQYYVFNPLSWTRTDFVDVMINSESSVSVIDLKSGEAVASQRIDRDQKTYLRFVAAEVPACGYRLFHLVPQASKVDDVPTPPSSSTEMELRTSQHQLRVRDDGSISHWEAKSTTKPLIDDSQSANRLEDSLGTITLESAGPVSTTVRVDIARPTARTTRITLFEQLDRIEIDNTIRENFEDTKTWRYAFNLRSPRTDHEEVGTINRAAYASDGGHYADRNARTQWLTLNHFVAMQDEQAAITISNRDCQFFHLGDDVTRSMDSTSNILHLLAGGQIDGKKLGIPKQGGDRIFTQRFAMFASTPSTNGSVQAMRSALEHQNPLAVASVSEVEGQRKQQRFSMLDLKSDHVVVWTLKPAEPDQNGAGQGTIVRLWNLSDKPSAYELTMKQPFQRCIKSSHIETDIEPMKVTDGKISESLPAGGMRTLRIL